MYCMSVNEMAMAYLYNNKLIIAIQFNAKAQLYIYTHANISIHFALDPCSHSIASFVPNCPPSTQLYPHSLSLSLSFITCLSIDCI